MTKTKNSYLNLLLLSFSIFFLFITIGRRTVFIVESYTKGYLMILIFLFLFVYNRHYYRTMFNPLFQIRQNNPMNVIWLQLINVVAVVVIFELPLIINQSGNLWYCLIWCLGILLSFLLVYCLFLLVMLWLNYTQAIVLVGVSYIFCYFKIFHFSANYNGFNLTIVLNLALAFIGSFMLFYVLYCKPKIKIAKYVVNLRWKLLISVILSVMSALMLKNMGGLPFGQLLLQYPSQFKTIDLPAARVLLTIVYSLPKVYFITMVCTSINRYFNKVAVYFVSRTSKTHYLIQCLLTESIVYLLVYNSILLLIGLCLNQSSAGFLFQIYLTSVLVGLTLLAIIFFLSAIFYKRTVVINVVVIFYFCMVLIAGFISYNSYLDFLFLNSCQSNLYFYCLYSLVLMIGFYMLGSTVLKYRDY